MKTKKESESIERALGYVPTPPSVVEFMLGLTKPPENPSAILEPACGDARFLTAFRKKHGDKHQYWGIDINADIIHKYRSILPKQIQVVHDDFLLWTPQTRFDIVIGNPPYGIVGDASHYPIHLLQERKSKYKETIKTWKGKYNLYGAFIEKSVSLLKPDGQLIFVVPTTWLVLDDFEKLRRFLAERGKIEVFYVGRVFPKINVSAVVLRYTKNQNGMILYDLSDGVWQTIQTIDSYTSVFNPNYEGEMIRFATDGWQEFEEMGTPLKELFDIRFAARSPEFLKRGLVRTQPRPNDVPVLTGRNLTKHGIDYETCYSKWWMRREDAPKLRTFYGLPHLVVGHTKGTQMVCAVDWQCYPWREEYHLIPKNKTIPLETIAQYLNSDDIQTYLKHTYRDFTPHLTKSMLEKIPLPIK
ncbi:MAG: modification methylase TthHB8I [Patescibacteria group bacterium]|nr:MAG: modification methylase TthHB8I [Patescibacteria group bacterium]